MKYLIKISVLIISLNSFAFGKDYSRPVELEMSQDDKVKLMWNAVPSNKYLIKTTSDLVDGQWSNGTSEYLCSNVIGKATVPVVSQSQYYIIEKKDEEPPEIESLYPRNNAIAVPTNSVIHIILEDQTGIDVDSITLSIGQWKNMTLSSGEFSFVSNVINFLPPQALGERGDVITNYLSVADTLGHNLNYSWSFSLELEPIVNPPDFIALVAPDDPAQQLFSKGGIVMRRTIPGIEPMDTKQKYTIVSVTPDNVVFSYEGAEPSITNETLLVSYDTANPFYRKSVSNAVDVFKGEVTVWTYDVSLESIIQQISMNAVSFTTAAVPEFSKMSTVSLGLHNKFGNTYDGLVLFEATNHTGNARIKLSLPECNWSFTTDVSIEFELSWAKLTGLDVTAKCEYIENLSIELLAEYSLSDDGVVNLASYTYVYAAMAGPIPVWVEIVLDLNAGYEYKVMATGGISNSFAAGVDASVNINLDDNVWSQNISGPNINTSFEPIEWGVDGSAEAKVYLQPKLTVFVYSLVGPWVDLKGYARAEGDVHINPLEGSCALYAGFSSDLGIECRLWNDDWGGQPQWNLFTEEWTLWATNYSYAASMKFVGGLSDITVFEGESVSLDGEVSSFIPPKYQWFYNNEKIPVGNSSIYEVEQAQFGSEGWYTVEASALGAGSISTSVYVTVQTPDLKPDCPEFVENGRYVSVNIGQRLVLSGAVVNSNDVEYSWSCNGTTIYGADSYEYVIENIRLEDAGKYVVVAFNKVGQCLKPFRVSVVDSPPTPVDMVSITAGTNNGNDPDFGDYTLTITNAFFIDKYEVTKEKWDEVYNWAVNHEYTFDNEGSGKASDHPVNLVNWYDCIKWCNARSEKEGLDPCYKYSGKVCKVGQPDADVDEDANGYRLPTHIEWQYAARGGLSGKRFPWGDTITHNEANYFSSSLYTYDTSSTRGAHPDYDDTSPVGSFSPNDYGLYDMSGNVHELCYDQYKDTTKRYALGGGWAYSIRSSNKARCGDTSSPMSPSAAYDYLGFRTVKNQ